MGSYKTKYSLEVKNGVVSELFHKEALNNIFGYDVLDGDGVILGGIECESVMRSYSKKYPNAVFELEGRGEFDYDLWVKYFKNGKMQLCEAVTIIPPYDESLLE